MSGSLGRQSSCDPFYVVHILARQLSKARHDSRTLLPSDCRVRKTMPTLPPKGSNEIMLCR